MEHISKEDFFKVLNVVDMKERNRKMYNRIYNKVIKEWQTPEQWFESSTKTIYIESRTSDCYWVAWSLLKTIGLPPNFICEIRLNNSKDILEKTLVDYVKIESTIEKMKKAFSDKYVDSIYSMIVRVCLFKGINDFSFVQISDVSDAYDVGLLKHCGYRSRISLLLYYADYTDKFYNDANLYKNLKEQKMKLNEYWSGEMKEYIDLFIKDLKKSIIGSYKMEVEKIRGLNIFSSWYCKKMGLDVIDDLLDFNRNSWLRFIEYIKNEHDDSNKTKDAKLRAVKDFLEWALIKKKSIISKSLVWRTEDFESLYENASNENLAFEKREHGEKILYYLMNEFQSDNVKDLFRKEAIIIAANCGARIEEIRRLEYGSCFFSEDEGVYKIIIDYADKLNRKDVPIYITKDGYEAIKRVEELKAKYDFLEESYDSRVGRKYVRLFEYKGKIAISRTSLYSFIERIKYEIGLVDENGVLVKGGMHSFRHFFGKTVFVESNYNIEVVRYLLRHKQYKMSYRYIQEEKELLLNMVQKDNENDIVFSGAGLDTIIEILMNNHNSEYKTIEKILKNSRRMNDLIENKKIKKVAFGYCLNPCKNANKCIRCNNYILCNQEQDEIINAANELFEIICFKKSFINSNEKISENHVLDNDVADLIIILKEIKNLRLDYRELAYDLKGVINNV